MMRNIFCVCCSEAIQPGEEYELVTLELDTEYEMCRACAKEAAVTSIRLGTYMNSRKAVSPVQSEQLPMCDMYPERCESCGPDYITNSGCYRFL